VEKSKELPDRQCKAVLETLLIAYPALTPLAKLVSYYICFFDINGKTKTQ
jgi:hypothetical protein